MKEYTQKPEGWVENDVALEGAYAEKPFRDAILKYREHLSDEEKEKLLWLASKEAGEAVKNYVEKKGDERERAKVILKTRALEALEHGVPKTIDQARVSPESQSFIKWALINIAEPYIDEILESPSTPKNKQESMQLLQRELLNGLMFGDHRRLGEFLRDNQLVHPQEGGQKIKTGAIYDLKGLFLKELLTNQPLSAGSTLEILKETGPAGYSPYEEDEMLPVLERWQVSPEADVIQAAAGNPRELVNKELERVGLVWDPDEKKYIRT